MYNVSEIENQLYTIDWEQVTGDLNRSGFAVVPGLLDATQCQRLIDGFDVEDGYRKTVVMERHRYGLGRYKYWDYPLPESVQALRQHLYPKLVPIANCWMEQLRLEQRFPTQHDELQKVCHEHGQRQPTPLILEYGAGGHNTLHQDLYGDLYFPIQAACFLSEAGADYSGGAFVMTEQLPRAQSKPIVLTPRRGDMILLATRFRPVKSARGYCRATMRHGVSEVHHGKRYTMGIIFHDAVS